MEVGDLIRINYLIFKETKNIDHFKGRPCVVVSVNDNYAYFLTLSHSKTYSVQNKDFPVMDFQGKEGYVNLSSIYKKPNTGFYLYNAGFNGSELNSLLKAFYEYQTIIKEDEYFSEIKSDIESSIIELSNCVKRVR